MVLDASGSMAGEPIKELNEGVKLFFDSVMDDEIARYSAEVCIITFGTSAKIELDFAGIEKQQRPTIFANGTTPMGEAVELAIELLEKRKSEYSDVGVDYYQPWMVLMTDGKPTDSIDNAVRRTVDLIERQRLTIFPIGIGDYADMDMLSKFSPKRKPLRLKGLNFKNFFEWLSKSVSKVSHSTPGEIIELDIDGIKGWGEL
jgi:uncharacterized protein YegL